MTVTETAYFVLFLLISIPVSIVDIKTLRIPLIYMYLGLIITIIFEIFFRRKELAMDIFSALLLFSIFSFIRIITKHGIGLGDVQFTLITGLFSGFPFVLISSLISSLLGILFYLFLYIKKINIENKKIPFLPFMSAGTLITLIIKHFI